jgi:hyaluronoglucosaminidase
MYDPGMFPALGNNLERRNGGVPQEGDLVRHLQEYKIAVNDLIPDVNNRGLAIIDFESWRPIFRQNFGFLTPYKDLSIQIERERHPFWTKSRQQQEVSIIISTSVL